jgi:hypothetical protein
MWEVAVCRPELTDQAWAQIQPLLPPTGRPVASGPTRGGCSTGFCAEMTERWSVECQDVRLDRRVVFVLLGDRDRVLQGKI